MVDHEIFMVMFESTCPGVERGDALAWIKSCVFLKAKPFLVTYVVGTSSQL